QPLGQQDFYTSSVQPYKTATAMVANACSLGNLQSQRHAMYFLQEWRRTGCPVSG
ncbi:hypothetical protein BU25DRAFT_309400, partial [Macroventuria anomochaeta]